METRRFFSFSASSSALASLYTLSLASHSLVVLINSPSSSIASVAVTCDFVAPPPLSPPVSSSSSAGKLSSSSPSLSSSFDGAAAAGFGSSASSSKAGSESSSLSAPPVDAGGGGGVSVVAVAGGMSTSASSSPSKGGSESSSLSSGFFSVSLSSSSSSSGRSSSLLSALRSSEPSVELPSPSLSAASWSASASSGSAEATIPSAVWMKFSSSNRAYAINCSSLSFSSKSEASSIILRISASESRPLSLVMVIFCTFLDDFSSAVTLRMPLASMAYVTLMRGCPRGFGGMSIKVNLPRRLQSLVILRSPSNTCTITWVWLSMLVLNFLVAFTGMVVLR
mmetsp:Transcript_88023/g.170523  ORF Transcript_88023/g.170523 Transcript_88023/m.170523 type:complete len:338 (-) Transcript_88023:1274-2287(-)